MFVKYQREDLAVELLIPHIINRNLASYSEFGGPIYEVSLKEKPDLVLLPYFHQIHQH